MQVKKYLFGWLLSFCFCCTFSVNLQAQAFINIKITAADGTDTQTIPTCGTASFEITLINVGAEGLINVVVNDPLSPGCNMNIGNLGVGESRVYTCSATNVITSFTNEASASGEGSFSGATVSSMDGTGVVVPTFATPVAIVSAESTCSTIGGTPTGGTIAAPSTSCPTGSTLMYATDGATFSTTLPTYDPTTPVTVTTRCDCGKSKSPTASVTTVPGDCPTCPILTAVAPIAIISAESTCSTFGGTPTGGTIAAPTTTCPTGSALMYSTDGTNFSATLPTYDPLTAVTVTTRCDCGMTISPTSMVTTLPGACPTVAPLAPDDLSVGDPCSCNNPNNIVGTTGLGLVELFHDELEVLTTADVTVTLTATDNNFLDANGNPIPVGTAIPQVAPGIYHLTFYTLPDQPAVITVSNGVSTESFTTASCSPCPSTIPTMSEWGLMIFGLLILNLGLVGIKRKEQVFG